MSLRFLADQCVPSSIIQSVRDMGHDATLLSSVLPIRAKDREVIAKAQSLGAILLSLNGDFADIVAYPPANYGGIVALQLHNHPEVIPQTMSQLRQYTLAHPDQSAYAGTLRSWSRTEFECDFSSRTPVLPAEETFRPPPRQTSV
jgi:predicted nuclease of predicted toxin-antitoxin system